MAGTEPDLVKLLNEAGHTEQATSLAKKLNAGKKDEPTDQERYDALPGNEKMNRALRGAGNRGSGDINADIRRAAGTEVSA